MKKMFLPVKTDCTPLAMQLIYQKLISCQSQDLQTCFPHSDRLSINIRLKQYKNLFYFFPKVVS